LRAKRVLPSASTTPTASVSLPATTVCACVRARECEESGGGGEGETKKGVRWREIRCEMERERLVGALYCERSIAFVRETECVCCDRRIVSVATESVSVANDKLVVRCTESEGKVVCERGLGCVCASTHVSARACTHVEMFMSVCVCACERMSVCACERVNA